MNKIYVIGVFDLCHIGHFNLFMNIKKLYPDSEIIVGVCSDDLVKETKLSKPVQNEVERQKLLLTINCIKDVIIYTKLNQVEYLKNINPNIWVVPPDYGYNLNHVCGMEYANKNNIKICKFDRTLDISTTMLKTCIKNYKLLDNNPVVTSKNFWINKKEYPSYNKSIKKRRFYEIEYIFNILKNIQINSLLDLGCGDGGFVKCIDNLLSFDNIYCYDISYNLLSLIPNASHIHKKIFDFTDIENYKDIPKTDVIVFCGAINFIFEDNIAIELMSNFNSKYIFIRAVCTLNIEDDIINKFSEQLNDNYSSKYRTVENTKLIIEKSGMKILDSKRIYPDDIESDFNTRQYIFYCSKNSMIS